MKRKYFPFLIILSLLVLAGCAGGSSADKDSLSGNDTISVPDTGYTGITQYMSQSHIVSEVTFKNGIREGLMKTFYMDGKLRMTFWYENGLREDSSKFYHPDGKLFRSTPYKHDTIDGTQIQYYKNGRIKARLKYVKGLRTPSLEEFTPEGKLVGGYPELVVNTRDEYQSRGVYRISLELSNKSPKVRYYRGDLYNSLFDTSRCEVIKNINGIGTLALKKTGTPKADYVGVIAEILTDYGNNLIVYRKIDLPYKDLD
jgi:hypothetical protein